MKRFLKKNFGVVLIVVIIVAAGIGFAIKMSLEDDSNIKVDSLARESAVTITPAAEDDVIQTADNQNDADADDNGTTDDEDDSNSIDVSSMYNEDGTIDVFIDGTLSVTELPDSTITGLATEVDLDPSSRTVLVNKLYPLEENYKPDDLRNVDVDFSINYNDEKRTMKDESASALEAMFECAKKSGYDLIGVSGFRSFNRQKTIYNNNLVNKGFEHTNKYSARPGRSEHQTGWAIDISCDSVDGNLTDSFINTPEGQWVKENCFRFGFIVRYPKDKEDITGYSYEPWHVRYVGYDLARYLYENDLTLDEYYGYVADLEQIEKEEKDYYDDLMGIGYEPTYVPMDEPTILETEEPVESEEPTAAANTDEPEPTKSPTENVTKTPTASPSTKSPTRKLATKTPTSTPTKEPTEDVTVTPSTATPSTKTPTKTPSTTAPATTKPATTKPATKTPTTAATTKAATTKAATTKAAATKAPTKTPTAASN